MRSIHFLAVALFAVSPAISSAQKPTKTTAVVSHSPAAGKGTPAYLSHHKDNSAAFLKGTSRSTHATELSKIEQQSLHSAPSAYSKQVRLKPVAPARLGAGKGDHNTAINFTGRSSARGLTTTNQKSGAKSSSTAPPKPH
jgi:hypothetical protein